MLIPLRGIAISQENQQEYQEPANEAAMGHV
jgi:hypothetical protein